jgi:hypothetical protein
MYSDFNGIWVTYLHSAAYTLSLGTLIRMVNVGVPKTRTFHYDKAQLNFIFEFTCAVDASHSLAVLFMRFLVHFGLPKASLEAGYRLRSQELQLAVNY